MEDAAAAAACNTTLSEVTDLESTERSTKFLSYDQNVEIFIALW